MNSPNGHRRARLRAPREGKPNDGALTVLADFGEVRRARKFAVCKQQAAGEPRSPLGKVGAAGFRRLNG
jgi:hypothetical protein